MITTATSYVPAKNVRFELGFSVGHLKLSNVEPKSRTMFLLTLSRKGAKEMPNSKWRNISFEKITFLY